MDIREITFDCLIENAGDMFSRHAAELAINNDLIVPNPNLQVYRQMEASGALLVIGAWINDSLIGYSVNFVMQHHHSIDVVHSSNDLLYVKPEHRRGRTGLSLIKETERLAKERGAHIVFWRAVPGSTLETILKAAGCGIQETVYYARL